MKLCFVCLGNICRSPMAEMLARQMAPADWEIISRATGRWEHGNPVHPGTRQTLDRHSVTLDSTKTSCQMTTEDFLTSDRIIALDASIARDLTAVKPPDCQTKIETWEIPDPYYTGDFEETYQLLSSNIQNLLAGA